VTPFAYLEPDRLQDALAMLRQYGAEAKVLAGGQALLLALKNRTVRPGRLLSLARIADLRGWKYDVQGCLQVGATTTYSMIETASLDGWHKEIASVAGNLADRAVRNMGTAEQRYDIPTLLVGVDAHLTAACASGERVLPASEFFDRNGGTRLSSGEILTRITFAPSPAYSSVAFEKFRFRVFDAAIVSVVCALTLDSDGRVASARLVVGAVERSPVLALQAAQELIGLRPGWELPPEFAERTAQEVLPAASAATRYRRYQAELIKTLTVQAVRRALSNARGTVHS
jgi:carbon-monoxide dehydrogenase medium subunit